MDKGEALLNAFVAALGDSAKHSAIARQIAKNVKLRAERRALERALANTKN